MIPRQLILKNFLSYQEATLDFTGLHVACISGANGAGKSSLLEAITWALWGQSRAVIEDDVIHLGQTEAQVDFWFTQQQQVYRVLRSRRRRQSTHLEFQVETPQGLRSLTGRGVRATQAAIIQVLKLDYDTFINAAYLRQGRVDEFMLKRPSERKQVLADLLQLDRYDALAEAASERSRQAKAQIAVLEQTVTQEAAQLATANQIAQERLAIEAAIATTTTAEQTAQAELQHLQTQHQQRHHWQQQLQHHQQQEQQLQTEVQRLQQERIATEQALQQVTTLLHQQTDILQGYQQWQQLQAEEEQLAQTCQQEQALQAERSQVQADLAAQRQQLHQQYQQAQTRWQHLEDQAEEIAAILAQAPTVAIGLEKLQAARQHLQHLDQRQAQVAPLLQRRQGLQQHIDRAHAKVTARLEELRTTQAELQQQQARRPTLTQAVMDVAGQLHYLEERRAYQQQVQEKGLERRSFMEQLQARQREYEHQVAQLEQKLALLAVPDACCPLCDRPLDAHHWPLVQARHDEEKQALLREIWVIHEQLAASEREIQVLRQEYRDVEQELADYGVFMERRGQLQAQMSRVEDSQTRLQQLDHEQARLARSLQDQTFAADLLEELQALDATLAQLPYDERDHALARGQVDRARWAEIKQAEITQAQRRQAQIAQQQPALQTELTQLQAALETLERSPNAQYLQTLEQQIQALNYAADHHQQVRSQLKQAQAWSLRYREWQQAQQHYPLLQQRWQTQTQQLQQYEQRLATLQSTCHQLTTQLQALPDVTAALAQRHSQLQTWRSQRDQQLARLGQLQQQQAHLTALQHLHTEHQQALQAQQHQLRLYRELAYAFGKHGIQTLMIENILPQLEAETNRLLGRLSAHQLHVQFVTQKTGRRSSKLIETLEILIADAQGTRPYETYSGGEAFRVNFAIRLALARLLAQQSGTALQMLIVDEGFGTQDTEGCDRLIAAVNAIAADFACILMVTHVPHFREAFQARIDVTKTAIGSCLQLLS